MLTRYFAPFALLTALSGCEASADLGGDDPTGSGVGSAAEAEGSSSKLPASPAPPEPTPPDATLAELQARCADPAHGPADSYADFGQFKTRLVGRWFACDSGDPTNLYQREAGIEFGADATWHLIRTTPEGTFVSDRGIDNEGTWDESACCGYIGSFRVHQANSDIAFTSFAFESAPQRMRTVNASTPSGSPEWEKTKTWFVPMGVAGSPPRTR